MYFHIHIVFICIYYIQIRLSSSKNDNLYIHFRCTEFYKDCHTDFVDLRAVFIRNLKFYRNSKKVRQLDLALEIGKSSNYINSIENGKYFPSPETIDKIAEYLDIEPMMLFDRKNPQIKENHNTPAADINEIKNQLKQNLLKDIDSIFNTINK